MNFVERSRKETVNYYYYYYYQGRPQGAPMPHSGAFKLDAGVSKKFLRKKKLKSKNNYRVV